MTTCSFDCNVYMWKWVIRPDTGKGEMRKIGSLVLGTERLWKIKIEKQDRVTQEKIEAEEMLQKVEALTLEQLFQSKKKDSTGERPLM